MLMPASLRLPGEGADSGCIGARSTVGALKLVPEIPIPIAYLGELTLDVISRRDTLNVVAETSYTVNSRADFQNTHQLLMTAMAPTTASYTRHEARYFHNGEIRNTELAAAPKTQRMNLFRHSAPPPRVEASF